jgi:hypothetical protein
MPTRHGAGHGPLLFAAVSIVHSPVLGGAWGEFELETLPIEEPIRLFTRLGVCS